MIAWIVALTLNIWALPDVGFLILSPLREPRRDAICEKLQAMEWDVVLIQEAWVGADRDRLKNCGYKNNVDLDDRSLPLDSGLLLLSKYPLSQVARLTYSATASVLNETGEAIARKSAFIGRVEDPAGAYWVANTHLISFYDEKNDEYQELRRAQFRSYLRWGMEKAGTEPVIFGGDLNFGYGTPLEPELEILMKKGFSEAPGSREICTLCPPNTMHARNQGRVDHLFSSPRLEAGAGRTRLEAPLETSEYKISLSDHFGWETRFRRKPQ